MSDKICPHCGQPMVIPEDELRAAENRIKLLDGLSPLCAWDKFDFQLNQKQRHARESLERVQDVYAMHFDNDIYNERFIVGPADSGTAEASDYSNNITDNDGIVL